MVKGVDCCRQEALMGDLGGKEVGGEEEVRLLRNCGGDLQDLFLRTSCTIDWLILYICWLYASDIPSDLWDYDSWSMLSTRCENEQGKNKDNFPVERIVYTHI
jgi:hypothetical protein